VAKHELELLVFGIYGGRVGVVFGMEDESPGAHNVIVGIFDALKEHNNKSILFGFVGKHKSLQILLFSKLKLE
jgi:hypothetical protein